MVCHRVHPGDLFMAPSRQTSLDPKNPSASTGVWLSGLPSYPKRIKKFQPLAQLKANNQPERHNNLQSSKVIAMSNLSAILMVLILSGCATAYQPTGFSGGFSEIQLADNVWQVSFEGNGYTKDKRARDLALLRSADLTLQQGYTHFFIADSANSHELSTFTMPATSYTTGSIYGSGRYAYGNATTTTYGGGTSLIKKPETTNVVHMFRGKPDVPFMVYEAGFICTSFGQKYDVTCGVTK